jgi:hypothetical protein
MSLSNRIYYLFQDKNLEAPLKIIDWIVNIALRMHIYI